MNKQTPVTEYEVYLQKEKYTRSTVNGYLKGAEKFTDWCIKKGTSAAQIDYKTLLKYIQYLQTKENTKSTVQHQIGTLKVYFKYLLFEHYRVDNPIETINIKGVKRVMSYNILTPDELEDLYYSFNTENYQEAYHRFTAKRNRVLVGLLVYQGLNTTELKQLELDDLQLYKGKMYIKSGARSKARTLELKSWQIIELLEYVKEIREEIIIHHQKRFPLWGNVEDKGEERLFIPNNARLDVTVLNIVKKLKRINNKVKNTHQIRASVITNWLKQYNLRQVQILAGHRYISSTERYLQDDLENLHEIVNNFHPIS